MFRNGSIDHTGGILFAERFRVWARVSLYKICFEFKKKPYKRMLFTLVTHHSTNF